MHLRVSLLLVFTCFFIQTSPASRLPNRNLLTTTSTVPGEETITCNHQSPLIMKRERIIEFIQSFCLEIMGEEFGGTQAHLGMKEIYTIIPNPINPKEATHLILETNCGRYLTRPTDECNIGEEDKQGGMVTDGCSIWTAKPI
ncbi:uncharacterized protein MELLADRAFT_109031 [Melampsora larici-populina 98AG31]|uniref:Secreted protein n=1 Tax=Melampsora larici-populina (strain 98AG31 / pathotype 3-4-7) TaxID=747676 RepID=F4RV35_MELLP|nr:uncharacterized protein MELLADRAFT_109031 [Melampsora larici-populina 98AG31]EGG03824.1 hypothetical protein MELLADRAFT_109031 [Melampsora larici-populina 98AG31]